ncbi:protein NCBP2AS2 homolog [Euwallacea fornicatus]|uniref:protein NCBP2AS2 homolog n=1 Tax=Euwallacea fornicatus TaxID=995702 RepID=UPI00338E09B2
MVFRFIIRLLANNEHLVQRLSESYPMRKAAQVVVRAMFTGKNFIQENRLHEKLTPEQFRSLMKDISVTLQKQVKQAHENIQKKMKQ